MKYAEITSLFNLHNIDYKALTQKIRNSKKSYTINLTRLEPFLKIIQSEANIVNKTDIPVNFIFNISADTYPTVTIKIEHINDGDKHSNILPHISNRSNNLYFDMSLNDFNRHDLSAEEMFERLCYNYSGVKGEGVSCSWLTAHMLQMIKKVDRLLNYDNSIYNLIKKNGIYLEKNNLTHECFDINISKKEFSIESKAKNTVVIQQSVFSINIDLFSEKKLNDIKITLQMQNQTVKLTYKEFVNSEIVDIENMIVAVLKLKNVHVNDMDNLKEHLLLQDMIEI
jgi:hypothetical protein